MECRIESGCAALGAISGGDAVRVREGDVHEVGDGVS